MSTIKVTNLRHASATSNNIALDSSNNAVVAGTLGCTGNLTITSGNLVVSSGNGIDFSAAAHASGMTSELLDDYEEGTFTPTATGATTAGTTTYTTQEGIYTKIGRQVTIAVGIRYTAATGTGLLKIGGLPYLATTSQTYGFQGAVEVSGLNWSGGTYLVAHFEPGDSTIYFAGDADDADRVFQSVTNETVVMRFTMTYFV